MGQKVLHKQERQKKNVNTERTCHHFVVGDKVYARSYRERKGKWMPATVIKITGPLSYIVKTTDNLEWQRHKNQLRIRHTPDDRCQLRDKDDFDNFPLPMDLPQNPENLSRTSSQVIDNNVSQSSSTTI